MSYNISNLEIEMILECKDVESKQADGITIERTKYRCGTGTRHERHRMQPFMGLSSSR